MLTPSAAEGDRHGWQAYVVQLDRRDEALQALRAEGIEVQIGTYALHRLGAYRDRGTFPGADRAFERALALPFATTMTEAECDRVAEALARVHLSGSSASARRAPHEVARRRTSGTNARGQEPDREDDAARRGSEMPGEIERREEVDPDEGGEDRSQRDRGVRRRPSAIESRSPTDDAAGHDRGQEQGPVRAIATANECPGSAARR